MWRRSARREVRAEAVSRPGWSSAFTLVGLGLLRTTARVDDVGSVEGGEDGGRKRRRGRRRDFGWTVSGPQMKWNDGSLSLY